MRLFIPFLASFLLVGCAAEQPRELAGYPYQVMSTDNPLFAITAGMMGCNHENTIIRQYDTNAIRGGYKLKYGSFVGLKCEGRDEKFHDCSLLLDYKRIDCLNAEGMTVRYSSL